MERVPTLEETLRAVVSHRYLTNIVRLAQEHECKCCGGVDCIDDWVAGYEDDRVT